MQQSLPTYVTKYVILGFILRLIVAFLSNNIFHPDEIYQSLEQTVRLVYGYGLIPWDIAYGLRTWWLAAFTGLPLWPLSWLSEPNPTVYIPLVKIWLSVLSLSIIPATYYLTTRVSNNRHIHQLATFSAAVWYELLHYSHRAFSEVIALNLLAMAIIVSKSEKIPSILTLSFCVLAMLIRPQYAILGIAIIWFFHPHHKAFPSISLGFLLGLLPVIITDWLTYGPQHLSTLTNLRLSFLSNASEQFGVVPATFYLGALIQNTGGLVLASLSSIKYLKKPYLIWIIILTIGLHSLIPHKEYRFLYGIIPLLNVTFSLTLYHEIKQRMGNPKNALYLAGLIISLWSLAGLFQIFPVSGTVSTQSPLFRDPYFTFYNTIRQDKNACGVFHDSRHWVHIGGYYLLGKNIAIFDQSIYSHQDNYNYLITTNPILPSKFSVISHTPPYYLAKRDGSCSSNFTAYRTFPEIESTMQTQQAHKLLKSDYAQ